MFRLSIIALLFYNPYKQKTMTLIFVPSALDMQHKGGTARDQENASEWNYTTVIYVI